MEMLKNSMENIETGVRGPVKVWKARKICVWENMEKDWKTVEY